MSYSKIKQWDSLVNDFAGLEEDEELLILLGERQYVVRVANQKDLERHNQTTIEQFEFLKSI